MQLMRGFVASLTLLGLFGSTHAGESADCPRAHVVFMLDASGSIEDFGQAKEFLSQAAQQLDENTTQFGLIQFADTAHVIVSPTVNKTEVLETIAAAEQTDEEHMTYADKAIAKAAEEGMLSSDDHNTIIVWVTDGSFTDRKEFDNQYNEHVRDHPRIESWMLLIAKSGMFNARVRYGQRKYPGTRYIRAESRANLNDRVEEIMEEICRGSQRSNQDVVNPAHLVDEDVVEEVEECTVQRAECNATGSDAAILDTETGACSCICKKGFIGDKCDDKEVCDPTEHCDRGATGCTQTDDTIECHCMEGWAGETCNEAPESSCANQDVVLAIDVSFSTEWTWLMEFDLAQGLATELENNGARVAVVGFGEKSQAIRGLDSKDIDFGHDYARAEELAMKLGGGTHYVPAATLGTEMLADSPAAKKHFIMITDGKNSDSRRGAADAFEKLRQTDVNVYFVQKPNHAGGFFSPLTARLQTYAGEESGTSPSHRVVQLATETDVPSFLDGLLGICGRGFQSTIDTRARPPHRVESSAIQVDRVAASLDEFVAAAKE